MGGSPKPGTTATTHTTTTTTTTRPVATTTGIGLKTVTWTDTIPAAGLAVNPAPGGSAGPRGPSSPRSGIPRSGAPRPTRRCASGPTTRAGPYPVIVFAHGFDTLPATYTALLSSWVDAGFVVVAPLFPDENANKISSLGAATTEQLELAESDVDAEPYDIAYVVGEVEQGATGAASSGAPWLKGLVNPGKYALAGHSDGAQAVAALVYSGAASYAATFDALSTRPFAVLILSGSELSGTYAAPSDAPSMLFVQSAVDQCNLPSDAATLDHDSGGGFFLKLLSAGHFAPYVGRGPAAPVVEEVTTAFLKDAVAGTPTVAELSPLVSGSHLAVLYGPGQTPVLASIPQPTPTQRAAACSPP